MPADKANAQAIANLTQDVADRLHSACVLLNDALQFAEDDYDHNGDKLRDAYGALRIVTSVIAGEHYTWHDYAKHREAAAEVGVTAHTERDQP